MSSLVIAGDTSGTVTVQAPAVAGTTTINLPATTGGQFIVSDAANTVNIPGTGARITGDFSNATVANRVMFQTSTANSSTFISTIPNGTAQASGLVIANNSNATNYSSTEFVTTNTLSILRAGAAGTGTYLPMTFYTGGSERMRIDTSGNVGIGSSSPGGKLDVTVNTASTTYAQVWNVYNGATFQFSNVLGGDSTNGVYFGPYQNVPLRFITSTTERMRIDTSGNVGVGTNSPSAYGKFAVIGSGDIGVFSNASNSDLRINIGTSVSSITNTQNAPITIGTNNTERFRIGTAGELGIAGTNYGTAGQVLTSGGSGAAPSWADNVRSGTAVSATGTAVDFTGIPSWVKRVTVMISGVSTNGTSIVIVQLGTSGGIENTGYAGGINTGSTYGNIATSGANIAVNNVAAYVHNGIITFSKVSSTSLVFSGAFGMSSSALTGITGGTKTLSGTLDRVRITTVNGTDAFDAGTINILYE